MREHNTEPAPPVGWRRYMGVGLVVGGIAMVAGFGGYMLTILSSLEEQGRVISALEAENQRIGTAVSVLGSDYAELVYLSGPEGSSGRILWDRNLRTGVLSARDLPPAGEGKEHRLWVVAGTKPSKSCLLAVSQSGSVLMTLDSIPKPPADGRETFIVTIEPAGATRGLSGTLVLAGSAMR